MQLFEAVPKKWGNSLGVTVPKEIVQRERMSPKKKVAFLVVGSAMAEIKKSFGALPEKKATQKIMDEIDEGYD